LKKYPIMTCLITSIEEAKRADFIDIYRFLDYENPLMR